MNWSNIEIDHVKLFSSFDVSEDEEMREDFNWKNTQPLMQISSAQRTKFDYLDFRLQFIRAY